ncbi:putative photosynthetic complex assembly protein 2 [Roseovarius nanhaiticus]|uniref:Putative photosynthetic complex assembly protein 2 n=1 Tax=Roseovarius nanhaiticus TaxID=573024 RepID=A0A1N7HHA1_9RHOB|nr:putative photosynthetic complex assembly protein PuhE [Roseovarius nanhaiticus]SEK95284.1 putative photosynthetic complex assembly protein 2 [Roseovarius nanhaiticus]SIS24060.1 putative photosynthetic complex assembly protein 2 [Roseovarius nanhaiticus]
MFAEIWIAAFTALFVWWFSTGAILIAVRRADRGGPGAHLMNTLLGLPLLVLGLALVSTTSGGGGIAPAYAGFLGALAIWGWIELAFLSGVITGPERRGCPPGLAPGARFMRAWWTVAYHELALLAGLVIVAVLSYGQTTDVALWTYLILFIARISAKLNVFFGVPRINTEFVPSPLVHLTSYFRQRPVTLMFPVSITILSAGTTCFLRVLWAAESDGAIVAATLLVTLSTLALVEHWLMIVPLPDAKLWRWMLPASSGSTSKESKTHGL